MSNYVVTVIKTGNSYALRVPKQYVEDGKLTLGQKASIELPIQKTRQSRTRIQDLLRELQRMRTYQSIGDAAQWQRSIRTDRPLPGRD